jgi:hypothetical protein
MKRSYLEEDLELIRKYFPGARSTRLRTPFDLTNRPSQRRHLQPDTFRDGGTASWKGSRAWIN